MTDTHAQEPQQMNRVKINNGMIVSSREIATLTGKPRTELRRVSSEKGKLLKDMYNDNCI